MLGDNVTTRTDNVILPSSDGGHMCGMDNSDCMDILPIFFVEAQCMGLAWRREDGLRNYDVPHLRLRDGSNSGLRPCCAGCVVVVRAGLESAVEKEKDMDAEEIRRRAQIAATDDGEAFRLAIDLGFKVEQDWFHGSLGADISRGGRARVFTTYSLEQAKSFDYRPQWFKVGFTNDSYKATRAAIAEAATWIADSMTPNVAVTRRHAGTNE